MKTYKQKLRECGVHWDWNTTKGELKDLIRQYDIEKDEARKKNLKILEICGLPEYFDLNHIHLHLDDLSKFVNFRKRLPTFEEVKAIGSHQNFSFWFNKEMNGDDFNSVWVYPSEIYHLYHSL